MRSESDISPVTFRDIESVNDLRAVEEMQKTAWGMSDLDIVPLTQLSAARHVGGTLIGAFDGEALVGFVFGFYGHMDRRVIHHSHMLAVDGDYRNHDLGYQLKIKQLERVRADKITDRITWTFDPLRSINAHLNFTKLGVLADTYKKDFYGEEASSFLHQNGTDRLLVTWLIESSHVTGLIDRRAQALELSAPSAEGAAPVLVSSGSGEPVREQGSGHEKVAIEIPADIGAVEKSDIGLARRWRQATRECFTEAFSQGLIVTEYVLKNETTGIYILRRASIGEYE